MAEAVPAGKVVDLYVTNAACEVLDKMLARRPGSARCLRLSTVQGQYRFIVDEPIEHDIAYRFEDRVVLVVSETVSRELWGITIDCKAEDGKTRLIFRKARPGEPLDAVRDDAVVVPPEWRAEQHERLLQEIAEIGRQIAAMRGVTRGSVRERLHELEAAKQEKWDAIRALWAGDGGWHKLQTESSRTGSGALQ